jgi:GNAT superfamily N-acetyltransferase
MIPHQADWTLRLAEREDVTGLERLIPVSVHGLQDGYYSEAQRNAAIGSIFAVDRQLIQDRTFFVARSGSGLLVGCGGWSHRQSLYGGDSNRNFTVEPLLDPQKDQARIRAFFVHPEWKRKGIGASILKACEIALRAEGFFRAQLVATLAGVPLYAAHGFHVVERSELPLINGLKLPVVRMEKRYA